MDSDAPLCQQMKMFVIPYPLPNPQQPDIPGFREMERESVTQSNFHFWTLTRRHASLTPPPHLLDWLNNAKENPPPPTVFIYSCQDQYLGDLVSGVSLLIPCS
jgi:hypothetical protein